MYNFEEKCCLMRDVTLEAITQKMNDGTFGCGVFNTTLTDAGIAVEIDGEQYAIIFDKL